MVHWVFTSLLAELFFAVINTRGDRLSRPGNWPQYRGNKQLTGRSLSRGRITQPKILWRHFTGARQTLLTVKLQSEDIVRPLPSIDYDATGGDLDVYYRGWGFGGPYYDLDQMGRVTRFTSNPLQTNNYKIGGFLPHVLGLEKVEWYLIQGGLLRASTKETQYEQ